MNRVEAVNEAIKNRRAIYTSMFSGKRVDDQIINQMLENANWAPTHKLTEPWRFVVFKGAGLQKLADFQSELYQSKSEKEGTFNPTQYEKLQSKPLECSHIIAIGMKRHQVVPEVEEVCAVAAAVQNMWITASSYGVGCYWSTGGVTFYEEAKPFFGLDNEDKLLGFLFIGMPKSDKWPEGRRKSIQDKVTIVE
ncbi:nitroreductase family protein [Fulvivirga lutea]|uniref:Putative NAD(P)H nitroreductase n=1 Tax=Fulvivirga lutea TaxID=2810512 RepID=A0A974WGM0_9BACT|nr:nitroreductase [Fulvivirga lutea]QSE98159.1 nitroreductase [Fulvivirga lutea]